MFAVFGVDPKKVKEKAHKQALAIVGKASKKAAETKGKTKVPAVDAVESELIEKLLQSTPPHSVKSGIQHANNMRSVQRYGGKAGIYQAWGLHKSTCSHHRQKRSQQNCTALCAFRAWSRLSAEGVIT